MRRDKIRPRNLSAKEERAVFMATIEALHGLIIKTGNETQQAGAYVIVKQLEALCNNFTYRYKEGETP